MQDQLPPNKTGNERGMLDPSSTGYDREMGNQNRMGEMQTMRSAGMGIGMGMREGAQTFAPSQAVFAQMQAAKTASASNG